MEEKNHNHFIDKLAILNAFLGAVALYPQLFGLIINRTTSDSLSPLSFGLILSNSIVWFWYGLHRRNIPLLISSSLNTFASSVILLLIFRFF